MRLRLVFVAAAVVLASMVVAAPVSAQYTGGTPPTVGPVVQPAPPVQGAPSPVAVQAGRAPAPRVAVTGADIAQMLAVAGVLVLAGVFLVRQGRRSAALT